MERATAMNLSEKLVRFIKGAFRDDDFLRRLRVLLDEETAAKRS